jgi:hypothetical protein
MEWRPEDPRLSATAEFEKGDLIGLPSLSGASLSRTNAQCVAGEAKQPSLSDPALRQRAPDDSRPSQLYRWLMDFARNHYTLMRSILHRADTILDGLDRFSGKMLVL